MCIHASWMTSSTCTRCNLPKTGLSLTSLGVVKVERVKRESLLPKKFIPSVNLPKPLATCVGCGKAVNPAWCYQGSGLSDLVHQTLRSSTTTPVLGVIDVYIPPAKSMIIGGKTIEVTKPVAFRKRTKGLICDSCASNYHQVDDGKGGKVPLVQTDPKGDYTSTLRGADPEMRTYGRSRPAFNTRVTQGRRGKRV